MSDDISDIRASYADELSDPAMADRLFSLTHHEVGTQGPQAQQAFIETVLNRAAARGQTLGDTINDPHYYPAKSLRKADLSPEDMDRYQQIASNVMQGSNISNYATGNASGRVGFAGGPQTYSAGGEHFGIEGPDIKWYQSLTGLPVPKSVRTPMLDSAPGDTTATPPLPSLASLEPTPIGSLVPDVSQPTPIQQAIEEYPKSVSQEPTSEQIEAATEPAQDESNYVEPATATNDDLVDTAPQGPVDPTIGPALGRPKGPLQVDHIDPEKGLAYFKNGMIKDLNNGTIYTPDPSGNMWMHNPDGSKVKIAAAKHNIKQNSVTGEWINFDDPDHPKIVPMPQALGGKTATMEDVAKLPAADRQKAEMYAEYHLATSPYGISRDKELNRLLPYIKAINPDYDAYQGLARKGLIQQYTSQRQTDPGGQIKSFNQSLVHLATLGDMADAMQNTWSPQVNSVKNWLQTAAGKPYQKDYEYASNIVATEMARAYKQGVPDQGDIQRQQNSLDSANSPAVFEGIIKGVAPTMIGGALETLDSGWEKTMNKPLPDKSLIYPPARNALMKMGINNFAGRDLTHYGGQTPTTPGSPTPVGSTIRPAVGGFVVGKSYYKPSAGRAYTYLGGDPEDEQNSWK